MLPSYNLPATGYFVRDYDKVSKLYCVEVRGLRPILGYPLPPLVSQNGVPLLAVSQMPRPKMGYQ